MSDEKRRTPATVGDVIASVLRERGLAGRVEQAAVIPEWPTLVGAQIAAVTEPRSVSADGTLWVGVRTSAWMNELSLLEPELLSRLNARLPARRIVRIRFQLQR